jgi:hypothetical protein
MRIRLSDHAPDEDGGGDHSNSGGPSADEPPAAAELMTIQIGDLVVSLGLGQPVMSERSVPMPARSNGRMLPEQYANQHDSRGQREVILLHHHNAPFPSGKASATPCNGLSLQETNPCCILATSLVRCVVSQENSV